MFEPSEIIFASTDSCNLHCKHCFVSRKNLCLDADECISFLKTCIDTPVTTIGFSGGEPFLYPQFLEKIISFAYENGFMFDRLMTNGDWWKTEDELKLTLQNLYDAGYDGKIGLSFDEFHNQDIERISVFIGEACALFGGDSVNIQSVVPFPSAADSNSDSDSMPGKNFSGLKQQSTAKPVIFSAAALTEKLTLLAEKLNAELQYSFDEKTGRGFASIRNDEIYIPCNIEEQSLIAGDKRMWISNTWFKDDFCEGPGQILYVHPDGNIAPCCGFANENQKLFIGSIKQDYNQIMKNASQNAMVKLCYETGLASEIKRFKKEGKKFPGKTKDICAFCDFICKL